MYAHVSLPFGKYPPEHGPVISFRCLKGVRSLEVGGLEAKLLDTVRFLFPNLPDEVLNAPISVELLGLFKYDDGL